MNEARSEPQPLLTPMHSRIGRLDLVRIKDDGQRFIAWLISAVLLIWFWQWYVAEFDVSPAVFPSPAAVWSSLSMRT